MCAPCTKVTFSANNDAIERSLFLCTDTHTVKFIFSFLHISDKIHHECNKFMLKFICLMN